ncbi:MAG: NAD-dependent epimerase/dehydratase family protein [Armatimonadetes bacterium]|nr:NAD-dependent epimerase/dehydratase family protein [Armatimonadota bacterium]
MNLLVIGGTQFVGRAMVEEAVSRGHQVTVFHRGQTNPGLFANQPLVKEILGDRKVSLEALSTGTWDAVIDSVGYEPPTVKKSCEALKGRIGKYAFISTISVYGMDNPDEDSPVLQLPEGASVEQFELETYGALKALCEQELEKAFPGALNMRIGLEIGPKDHSDRFNDWVDRIRTRDKVMVPGGTPMMWQAIDVRDTARFTLDMIEKGGSGTYNVTGEALPMPQALDQIRSIANPSCEFVTVDPDWMLEQGITPWEEYTLWIPESEWGQFPLVAKIDRALAAGMKLRPREESIRDIVAVQVTLDPARKRIRGLSKEKEDALLAKAMEATTA